MKANFYFSVFFLLLSHLSFSQSDEDFSYATSSKDGIDYFVYIEKTEYDGSKSIWVKSTKPIKTIKNKKGKTVKTGGGKTLTFMKIDCSERTFDILETIEYDKSGNVVKSYNDYSYGNRIVPGSIMTGIHGYVCDN